MNTTVAAEQLARTGEGMKSGPIGLAIILLLCIACYFLFKSMSGHLRKVRGGFPAKQPPSASDGAARAVLEPKKPSATDDSATSPPPPPADQT